MKKIFLLTFGLFFVALMSAQIRPVLGTYSTTLQGKDTDTIDINLMPGLEYLSLQLIPSWGATLTDSMDFSYVPYIRNTYTGSFSAYAAAKTVSAKTAAAALQDVDAFTNFAPFQGLQLRLVLTGISTDTAKVTVYTLQK